MPEDEEKVSLLRLARPVARPVARPDLALKLVVMRHYFMRYSSDFTIIF